MQVSISYSQFEDLKGHIENVKNFCTDEYGCGMSHSEVAQKLKEHAKGDSRDVAYLAATLNELIDEWEQIVR